MYVHKQYRLRTIPCDGDALVKLPPLLIIQSPKHRMTALGELYKGQFGETQTGDVQRHYYSNLESGLS